MSSSHATADPLAADLRRIFGDRLLSVVLYGSHAENDGGDAPVTCLALVRTLTVADLDACARASHAWRRQRFATPLILPESEFRRSFDAFPLEYSEIVRAHVRVYGDDPFDGVAIASDDLRRACETQVKSHLVHLRQEYIKAAGKPHEIATLVTTSSPAFAALLRNVARLHGATSGDRGTVTREGARLAGLPEAVVAAILAFEHPASIESVDASRIFPEHLTAVEQLASFVDTWRQ